jgi:hypothetical protein
MALRKPLVIVNGQIQALQSGDSIAIQDTEFNLTNHEASAVVCGAPVYIDAAAGFKKAQANAAGTSDAIGLVAQTPNIANGASGAVCLQDVLTLTTTQWDAVTGQTGGLTPGKYYLDPATAGKMTTTPPSTVGQLVVELGRAMSTVDFKVEIKASVLL